ncbi:hypothetical protein AO382_0202 [Moraxella catarrhalis]|uniref:Uncharacterized protein n=1 Tax=Moraxella catarrhalis TaxID=480 RepID=A0A7Z0UZS8_MORCA|nr:hypothetical protein AO382_0202 [Moraxella catarrhalis]
MFHSSHFIIKNVKYQFNNTAFPPCPKCMVSTLGGFDELSMPKLHIAFVKIP